MEYNESYIKFGEYISELFGRHFEGMNQTEIAIKLNTQQGQVSKWYKGERLPSDRMIKIIKHVTGIDITDRVLEAKRGRDAEIRNRMIRNGESTYFDKETETLHINNNQTKPRIPVKVAAGQISEYYSGIYESMCDKHPIIRQFQYYDFTMIVQGNSMEPKYEGGDEIACVKVNKTIRWGEVYVLDTNDGAFLKRVYDDGDRVRCVSYNKEYPDFYVDKTDIVGMYRIVGLLRYNH